MEEGLTGIELMAATAIERQGSDAEPEFLISEARRRFPGKGYCRVYEWTVFRADVSADDLETISSRGHLPFFVYAHRVAEDSRGRFRPGEWVRSSMAISFDGVMFETKNTVYILQGAGHERLASLKTIFSFY